MSISTTIRLSRPVLLFGSVAIFLIFLFPHVSNAQTVILQDGFNGACTSCSSTNFTATLSGTPDYYGMSTTANNTGCPNATAFAYEGGNAFHVRKGNVTLTSANINTCSASNLALSFKLAAYSNSNAEGLDNNDYVEVSISNDGGTTYFPTLRVTGNSNAKWLYSASGTATTAYDGNASAVVVGSSAGNTSCTLLSDGISTVQITNLPATVNLRVRIQMVNELLEERWLIDDFRLTSSNTVYSYCSPAFSSGIEPITNVTFAGINNTTANTLGGSSLESFCNSGTVTQGATHSISLKGNTAGNYVSYFQVYIDWNQNGVLNNVGESYNVGTITNSTGIDATVLTGNIAVPAGATLGNTRMRIVKKYDGYASGPCQTGGIYGQAEDYILVVVPPSPSATLLNYAANPILSTSFAHRRGASNKPKFTINASSTFNAVQIELNQASDFSGTALVSTIIDGNTYNASTSYDFWTTEALTGDRTYFVRVRLSSNGGSLWGQWTTQLWPYSYYPSTPYADEGWHYTTQEQFSTGTVQESTYNFLNANNNSTAIPDDDFMQLNQGTFVVPIIAGEDDGGRENGWYGTSSYLDFGWVNESCAGNTDIVNLFRFRNLQLPVGSTINSAALQLYSATGVGDCPQSAKPSSVNLSGYKSDNSEAPSNTISLYADSYFTTAVSAPWILGTTAWGNNELQTLPDASNIIQEIINRPGWTIGNSIMLRMKWDPTGGVAKTDTRHRFIRMFEHSSGSLAPRLDLKFSNFKNTVRFPAVNRTMYGPTATMWNELKITDNTTGCGTCYTEYRIHDASNNAVVAGPFLRSAGMSGLQSFNIASVTQQNVYVSATIFRNSSPQILDIWLTATTPAPLPIELTSFEAACENGMIHLNWSTATEHNSDFFSIESSADGIAWTTEGILKAAGNSSVQKKYTFSDHKSQEESIVYYRLKSTDFDGAYKYSNPVAVHCEEKMISIFPNPNNGSFIISGADRGDTYVVHNYQGQLVSTGDITSLKTDVDLKGMTDGVYLIKISSKIGIHHFKVIIRN